MYGLTGSGRGRVRRNTQGEAGITEGKIIYTLNILYSLAIRHGRGDKAGEERN